MTGPRRDQGRALPIRVLIGPGEALDSWLEALARRNEMPLRRLMSVLELPWIRTPHTPLLNLPATTLRRVEHRTGLTDGRLDHAILDPFAPDLLSQPRQTVRDAPWPSDRSSRYCPACLADTDGRWQLTWRLSWLFACTHHQVLLRDTCPSCGLHVRATITTDRFNPPPAATCWASLPGGQCGTDLRDAPIRPLPADHVFLTTQHQINQLLTTAQTGSGAQKPTLNDLRTLTGWLLDHGPDLNRRDSDRPDLPHREVIDAWHGHQTHCLARRQRPGQFLPAHTLLMAALATQALPIIHGDDDEAIIVLRRVLDRVPLHQPTKPPGMSASQWLRLSPHVHSRFLRALHPDLIRSDQLRYRTHTPAARLVDADARLQNLRARSIPQLFWPGWTIRLLPGHGFHIDPFRASISACLLLPGNPERQITRATDPTGLRQWRPFRIRDVLMGLDQQSHHDVLTAICLLADHLDERPSPIDYDRRRAIIAQDDALLTHDEWRTLCGNTDAHPGQQLRFRSARRYLYQLLTGADLTDPDHDLAFTGPADRTRYLGFADTLTTPLRQALHNHAAAHLNRLGLNEPLTWEPPTSICEGLNLPGKAAGDIDLNALHQLLVANQVSLSRAAEHLNITIDQVRLVLDRVPRQPRRWSPGATPTAWHRQQQAQTLFTREFFDREYVQAGKQLRQLEAETGFSRHIIARYAHATGIQLISASSHAPIDEAWLREQYLDRRRPFTDIARELGMVDMTVINAAKRFGIPARPTGVTSFPTMVQRLDETIPNDIRSATEGNLNGWQRLHRYQHAMQFPTIKQAADSLGVFQGVLIKQLQRLEADIGAQLYHRWTHQQPLRPTTRGRALLQALTRPDIRALTEQKRTSR